MLYFSIEPWDSLSKAYSYDFFLRNPKPCKEVDTIYLERKIPNKFEVIESSSYTREYNLDPSFIKLLPNTQYIVSHTGMGARVNIFKSLVSNFYWTLMTFFLLLKIYMRPFSMLVTFFPDKSYICSSFCGLIVMLLTPVVWKSSV